MQACMGKVAKCRHSMHTRWNDGPGLRTRLAEWSISSRKRHTCVPSGPQEGQYVGLCIGQGDGIIVEKSEAVVVYWGQV